MNLSPHLTGGRVGRCDQSRTAILPVHAMRAHGPEPGRWLPVGAARYGRSARCLSSVGLGLLLVFASGRLSEAAELNADERVVFYSTPAWRVPGGWEGELRGCVFEREPRPLATPILRRALGIDDDELSLEERALFRARARIFMVDHEGGKTVNVQLVGPAVGRKPLPLGPSDGSGEVTGRLQIKDGELAALATTNGRLPYVLITSASGRGPIPAGEVHLLAETGLSVISDIDDTIKVSQVRDRQELLRNTFCRPFKPVPGMAAVYQGWAQTNGAQFHYVSASPWQLYVPLAEFVQSQGFPAGTFHLKNFRVKDGTFLALFASPERYKPGVIEPLLERYPKRRFVLVGDSGEQDPEIYGALARRHPRQIARILIRDVTSEAADAPRYRQAFAGLPDGLWRVFKESSEITGPVP
jgi:hypothetical protein